MSAMNLLLLKILGSANIGLLHCVQCTKTSLKIPVNSDPWRKHSDRKFNISFQFCSATVNELVFGRETLKNILLQLPMVQNSVQ